MAQNGSAACASYSRHAPDSGSRSGFRADPPWACAHTGPAWVGMARCVPIPHRSDRSGSAAAQTQPDAYGALSSTLTPCGAAATLSRSRATFSNGLLPRLWPFSEFCAENQRLKLLIEIQSFQRLTPKMAKVEL